MYYTQISNIHIRNESVTWIEPALNRFYLRSIPIETYDSYYTCSTSNGTDFYLMNCNTGGGYDTGYVGLVCLCNIWHTWQYHNNVVYFYQMNYYYYFWIRSHINGMYHIDKNRIMTLCFNDDYLPETGTNTMAFDGSIGIMSICKVWSMRRDVYIDDINKKGYSCINTRSCLSKNRCSVPTIILSLFFINDFEITTGAQPYSKKKLGVVPICKV